MHLVPISADLKSDWSGQDLVVSHKNLASLARPHFLFLPTPFHSHMRIPEIQYASRDYRSGKLVSQCFRNVLLGACIPCDSCSNLWRTYQVHWCEPNRDASECNVSGCGWTGLCLYNHTSVKYKHCLLFAR